MYAITEQGDSYSISLESLVKAEELLDKATIKSSDMLQFGNNLLDRSNEIIGNTLIKKGIEKSEYIALKKQFNKCFALSSNDYILAVSLGLLASIVQIFMIGIPQRTSTGTKAAPLSNHIRDVFEKKYSTEEIRKIEKLSISKVPFDAQTNVYAGKNITGTYVDGLNPYYHRLVSLGHDPLLGFIVGVFDIMTGSMTTIDRTGKLVVQQIEKYANRKETDFFSALAKEIIHLKTDVTTSMGLPAPFMGVANLFQFGRFGEDDKTVAQIVQGMYYEGYDFIHYVSTTIPSMIIETAVRLYFVCHRLKKEKNIIDAANIKKDVIDYQKMQMVLLISHAILTSINVGQLLFTKNPMSINYNEWLLFAKYFAKQCLWQLLEKPNLREKYIQHNASVVDISLLEYLTDVSIKEKFIVLEG